MPEQVKKLPQQCGNCSRSFPSTPPGAMHSAMAGGILNSTWRDTSGLERVFPPRGVRDLSTSLQGVHPEGLKAYYEFYYYSLLLYLGTPDPSPYPGLQPAAAQAARSHTCGA